jgi:hypothetical protein
MRDDLVRPILNRFHDPLELGMMVKLSDKAQTVVVISFFLDKQEWRCQYDFFLSIQRTVFETVGLQNALEARDLPRLLRRGGFEKFGAGLQQHLLLHAMRLS